MLWFSRVNWLWRGEKECGFCGQEEEEKEEKKRAQSERGVVRCPNTLGGLWESPRIFPKFPDRRSTRIRREFQLSLLLLCNRETFSYNCVGFVYNTHLHTHTFTQRGGVTVWEWRLEGLPCQGNKATSAPVPRDATRTLAIPFEEFGWWYLRLWRTTGLSSNHAIVAEVTEARGQRGRKKWKGQDQEEWENTKNEGFIVRTGITLRR